MWGRVSGGLLGKVSSILRGSNPFISEGCRVYLYNGWNKMLPPSVTIKAPVYVDQVKMAKLKNYYMSQEFFFHLHPIAS